MADIQSNIDLNVNTSNALASIKLLQSQISAFHTQMAKSNAQMAKTSAAMQSDLLNSINRTGKFSASIQNIKSTTESFTTALEKNKLSLGEYFRYAGASTKSFGSLFKTEFDTINKVARERVKDLQTQYIKLGRDASGSLRAIAVRPLSLDMNDLATKTAIAAQKQQLLNQMLKQGSTNLLNFGKNTQWAGRQLMVGFTIPLSIAATTAAKSYMEIEKAAIKLQRVYGDLNTTAAETRQITKQIQELASSYTQYGVAVADTMDMAAQAAAMGKTGADLLAQIDNATRLSVLGGVDQNTALETTISLTNSFGIAADKLSSKVNFLNAVENQTVLNIEDMTTAIPKAAPVVKQLGGDVEDLAFFLTAMKEGGINASEGANALKSGLSSLINPSKKASEFLAGFGVNVKGIVENDKGNLKKTVVDFAKALDKIDPLNRARAIEMMFGKFQFARISTLLQNVNKEGSQASKALGLAEMSSIQLAAISRKELEKVASSPMYKFQKAMADIKLKLAPVGESFLKAVTPVIGFVSKILDGFNNMSDGAKQFAVIATVAVAGLGPILLMTFGLIANGVANIIKLFANIKSFFNKTTTASKVLGETTDYMTQEQLKAEAVAASLDQIHGKLTQTFTSEAAAVGMLAGAYERAVAAQGAFSFGPAAGVTPKKFAAGGVVHGPGTSTSDSVPANLSTGEVVLSVATVKKNPSVVAALLSGKKVNVAKFADGGIAGGKVVIGGGTIPGQQHTHAAMAVEYTKELEGEFEKLIPGFASFSEEVKGLFIALSDLTTQKPTVLNQKARAGGYETGAEFKQDWSKNPNGFRETGIRAASAGQMNWNGAATDEALMSIDKQIGDRVATEIDKIPQVQKQVAGWLDELIAKVTDSVISEAKQSTDSEMANVAGGLSARKGTLASARTHKAQEKIINPATGTTFSNANEAFSHLESTGQLARVKSSGRDQLVGVNMATGEATSHVVARTKSNGTLRTNSLSPSYGRAVAGGTYEKRQTIDLNKLSKMDDEVSKEMNSQSQSASPSKKTKQAAKNMVDGVDVGLKEGQEEIKKTGKSFGATTSKIIDDEFKKVAKSAKSAVATPVSNRVMAAPGKSQFMADMRSSAANFKGNIAREGAWIKEDFSKILNDVKSLFGIKGKETVTELKSALIKETPQITVAGKKMGFDYVAALKGGNGSIAAVVTSGNAKIISKAIQEYNAGGYRVAGAVSLGLDRGIAATVARSIIAGKKLAEAEVSGVMSVVPTAAAKSKVRALGMNEQGPLLPGQVRGTFKERAAAGIDSKMANFTSGKLAGIGMAASTAAFALSGIPGPVGQFASALLPLVSISSLLAPLMTAFSGALGMTIGELVIAALPFVAIAAGVVAAFALATFWINSVNDAKKKELAQINATSTASKAAASALDELAKQSGGGETNVGGSQSEAALKGQSVKTLNDAQTLVQSKEFNDPTTAIGKAITGLKGVKNDKDRKAILASTARNLVASGLTPEAAAANVDALQTKANEGTKRKNIVIDTKEFTFNSAEARKAAGRENLPAISRIAQGYDRKAVAKSVEQAQRNYIVSSVAADDMGRRTGINSKTGKLDPAAFKKLSKAQQAELKAIAENTKKSTKEFANYDNSVKTFSTNAQQNLKAVGNQFLTGKISLKEYKASLASVAAGFNTLDEAGKKDVLKGMRDSLAVSDPVTAQIAGTIANAAQQLQFLQLAAAGGAGAIGPDIIAKMNAGDKAATAAFNAASAKYLGSAQANYKKENPAGDQTGGAGGDKATDLMKPIKEGMLANKITNKFSAAGYNKDFIAMLATADSATQKVYMTFKNGIPVLNAHGKALMKAFNAKVISDYLTQQSQAAKDAKAEVTTRNKLVTAGIDYKDAVEAAKDATLQAALATAKTKAEVDKVIGAWKKVKSATEAALTPQEQFSKITDQADAYFSAKQNEIELKFKMDPTNIANQAVVAAAEADIATKQYQQDQYNSGLNKIAAQEDVINKAYDKRVQALDAIQKANDVIAAQQKSQLTLADALSQGDIAAAARAAQEIRATSASDSINSQKDLLDKTRQAQLDNLKTNVNGTMMTRAQIEEKIKGLETDIAAIEDGRLKPAQRALELATAKKDVELEALTSQQNEWDLLKNKVELANSAIKNYVDLLKQAQALAGQISGSSGSTYDPYGGLGKAGYDALVVTAKAQQASGLGAQGIAGPAVRQLLRMSTGGMVPKYFASGGYARGTDTIPAMLTPGEFVITKTAASNLGMDKLRSMNNGTYAGDSMYNYNLSVNVSGSSLDANDVARTVMDQIKRVDSQRLQGNRF